MNVKTLDAAAVKDILVINPGSTTTKIGVFDAQSKSFRFVTDINHDDKIIRELGSIAAQKDYRAKMIRDYLCGNNYDVNNLSSVVGRGGMIIELESGGYLINERLCERMAGRDIPQHASSLGALIAFEIAKPLGLPSFIYDSTMGCELLDVAKVSGIKGVEKYGCTHLLNSRAQAIRYCESINTDYRTQRFIVAHMGGGITVNGWIDGRIVDVAGYDDGPMGPERSGGVPLLLFNKLCFDGQYSYEEVDKLICGEGGMYSYLGTKDCRKVQEMIEAGDKKAETVFRAMALQVAKSIAGLSCTLEGKVDFIIITGGVAHSQMLTEMIKEYCGHIGKIVVMPGEREMEALALGAIRMLTGEEKLKEYR